MSKTINYDSEARRIMSYAVFGVITLTLIYRFLSHSLLSQLEEPVLKDPYVDITYWIFHLAHIPELITGSFWLSLGFDLALITFAVMSCYAHRKTIWPILFGIFYLTYMITYNSFSCHHTHCMAGIVLISIPFWFKDNKAFSLLWEGVRFYTLFIYSTAFLWKLFRGSLFHAEQGFSIMLNESTSYLLLEPKTWRSRLYWNIIEDPNFAHQLIIAGALVQGVFLIGFFTRKLDWLWVILPIIFQSMTYLLFHVMIYELLILSLVFLPWHKIREQVGRQ
ncbi:MAG: hypothetical protein AAF598_12445 [Bacteroidota bacterium]